MDTERAAFLLDHFKTNGVSLDPKKIGALDHVLAYQDIVGRSTPQEIRDYEESLNPEQRKNFIWVNFLTLSQGMAIDILNSTLIHRFIKKDVEATETLWHEEATKHHAKERQLADSKKHIYRKIRALEDTKALLIRRTKAMIEELDATRERNRSLSAKNTLLRDRAEKFDQIRTLLTPEGE